MIKYSLVADGIYKKFYFVVIVASALLYSCNAANIRSSPESQTDTSNKIIETKSIEGQNTILTEVIFYAAGTWTAVPKDNQPSPTQTPVLTFQACKSSLVSRLKIGDKVEIILEEGNHLRVREKAGLDGKILYKAPNNMTAVITNGPICVDEIIWWQINTENDRSGWVAEFQDETYLLKPIK